MFPRHDGRTPNWPNISQRPTAAPLFTQETWHISDGSDCRCKFRIWPQEHTVNVIQHLAHGRRNDLPLRNAALNETELAQERVSQLESKDSVPLAYKPLIYATLVYLMLFCSTLFYSIGDLYETKQRPKSLNCKDIDLIAGLPSLWPFLLAVLVLKYIGFSGDWWVNHDGVAVVWEMRGDPCWTQKVRSYPCSSSQGEAPRH